MYQNRARPKECMLVFNNVEEWLLSRNQFHILHRPRRKKFESKTINDKEKKNAFSWFDRRMLYTLRNHSNPTAVDNEHTWMK